MEHNNVTDKITAKELLIGFKLGNLTIVDSEARKKNRYFKCLCDCGNYIYKRICELNNSPLHCGCKKYSTWNGVGDLPNKYVKKISNRAKRKNIEFKIDTQYLWELFEKQNGKCAISGIKIFFPKKTSGTDGNASVDRIDSKIGYIEGNVQWVCKIINKMKINLSQEYFLYMCNKVRNYNE